MDRDDRIAEMAAQQLKMYIKLRSLWPEGSDASPEERQAVIMRAIENAIFLVDREEKGGYGPSGTAHLN